MDWINLLDSEEPQLGTEILFWFDNKVHIGSVVYNAIWPIKWQWNCRCCGDLFMEKVTSGSEIRYWMPLPCSPSDPYDYLVHPIKPVNNL